MLTQPDSAVHAWQTTTPATLQHASDKPPQSGTHVAAALKGDFGNAVRT
jgi:hypothetical protein